MARRRRRRLPGRNRRGRFTRGSARRSTGRKRSRRLRCPPRDHSTGRFTSGPVRAARRRTGGARRRRGTRILGVRLGGAAFGGPTTTEVRLFNAFRQSRRERIGIAWGARRQRRIVRIDTERAARARQRAKTRKAESRRAAAAARRGKRA